MASYAAVLSLFHTLNNIKIHPRPPISLDPQQLQSLTQNLTFFQDFLERHSCTGEEDDDILESRIAAVAYAAEDVIETHIVDQIHHRSNIFSKGRWKLTDAVEKSVKKIMGAQKVDQPDSGSTSHGLNIHRGYLYQDLGRVIGDMDLIKREVMEIIQDKIMTPQHHPHLHTNSSGVPASTWQSSAMPVFDDAIITDVLDKLIGQQSGLQIIPIIGMGGIGKTTFARNIYAKPLIVQYFDTMAWVTISQQYSRRNILQVLYQEVKGSIDGLSEMSEDEIGQILYKHLCGRRYLIVMDDIWSVEAWDTVKSFFPDSNGSRIMITTRLSNLAIELSCDHVFQMQFLDDNKSWNLLCEIMFGKLNCPIQLENIGKEIARKCRGLPLGIAVIGGLLKKSNMTQAYWSYTLGNLNAIINLENDEYTLRILRTSYKELPVHLKPCFLYIGIFPEDYEIKASLLIKLWIAEGILRPIDDKNLEEVAKEYLKELIDRNLILIAKLRPDGEARLCKIHDLLRDVCLRESQKQKFFCVVSGKQKHHTPRGMGMDRRICIDPENTNKEYSPLFLNVLKYAPLVRSLLSYNDILEHANLRYISLISNYQSAPRLLSVCSLFWNLQTLKVDNRYSSEPIIASAIWEMPLLRHVMLYEFELPDPPGEHKFVLENLQRLSLVKNFKFSDEVVKRIPNLKKLKVKYERSGVEEEKRVPNICINNLGRLQKLESFNLNIVLLDSCEKENIRRNLVSFPHSLKKLILSGTELDWEDLTTRIGSLPLLQFLRLSLGACRGPKWKTVEGQFCSLQVLQIADADDLKYWDTDSSHFPRLEHLLLQFFEELEEIPSSIGDIPTLKSIQLVGCSKFADDSAKRIKAEQEENGNEDLQVIIYSSSR
ncbi:hypothetical protein ACS0TY_000221 [Phlomoides rotata]